MNPDCIDTAKACTPTKADSAVISLSWSAGFSFSLFGGGNVKTRPQRRESRYYAGVPRRFLYDSTPAHGYYRGTGLFMSGRAEVRPVAVSEAASFATTHWSVVLNAQGPSTPEAMSALEILCRTYYYPLYLFVRRQGHDFHAAQDLTQEFFQRFVEKDCLASVAPEKGRFRSFLLASLKNFLSVARLRERTLKRGGHYTFVPLDNDRNFEERYLLESNPDLPHESAYDRGWATTLMERALENAQEEFQREGKADQFQRLKVYLSREPGTGEYARLAAETNMSPGAISVAVHRLRQRYGQCVRTEVAKTVAHPADVEEELRYLFSILTAP